MSTSGNKSKPKGNGHLNKETKVIYNKESSETVSMNNERYVENGIEASNSAAEAASTAIMDEFRRDGIVMLAKMEENGYVLVLRKSAFHRI